MASRERWARWALLAAVIWGGCSVSEAGLGLVAAGDGGADLVELADVAARAELDAAELAPRGPELDAASRGSELGADAAPRGPGLPACTFPEVGGMRLDGDPRCRGAGSCRTEGGGVCYVCPDVAAPCAWVPDGNDVGPGCEVRVCVPLGQSCPVVGGQRCGRGR